MRDQEYYDFDGDELHINSPEDSDYISDSETRRHGNEMARSAVEDFLESKTSDYIVGYDSKRDERPDRLPRTPRLDDYSDLEPPQDTWRPAPPPTFEDDEEFMAQLANIRRDRPRRRDTAPTPKPAVRVNSERRRRVPLSEDQHGSTEWALPDDEDYNTFRPREAGPDILSPPREATVKEPRAKSAAPIHRRELERGGPPDGPSPLRYLLAAVFFGVLVLMAFLAMNNRNLRRDLDYYQGQINEGDNQAAIITGLNLELENYRETINEYRTQLEQLGETPYTQINGTDVDVPNEANEETQPYYTTEEPPSRPSDETPTTQEDPPPPPAPEQTIHVVQAGEVLSRIAYRHFGSSSMHYVNLIVAANYPNLANANDIRIGQELIIPPRE